MLTVVWSADSAIALVAVGGALIGSFLNVIIFRLPRGLSISEPRWSFCPHCQRRIRPYHNLPVIGWLWLRGRCRDCRASIGIVYPIVECATALLFVMVWDALFVVGIWPGIGPLPGAWPLAVGFLILFSGLLATSIMDIESYTIDIRLSEFTMVAGVICHAIRGAGGAAAGGAAGAGLLPAALGVVGAAMGLAWWVSVFVGGRLKKSHVDNEGADPRAEGAGGEEAAPATAYTETAGQRFRPWPVVVFALFVAGTAAWQMAAADRGAGGPLTPAGQRGLLACLVFMGLLVAASVVKRESDSQIEGEIEAESDQARRVALREFAGFLPALLIGAGLFVYFRQGGRMGAELGALLGLPAGEGWVEHLGGALAAAAGMVFAAALGWAVRILGTLAFGKEAFGTGDIYIMAAIGAVAGFWAVVFSFFLAALLALVGVAVTRFWKVSRAIPFGPWLAMGAFVNLWLHGVLLSYFHGAGRMLWAVVSGETPWRAMP